MHQNLEAARDLLQNHQDLSTLQSVVNELSAQGVTGLLVDSWHLMSSYLKHPFSRYPPGILPINEVQEKAERSGMDLESMICDFEVEIKKGSPEAELYLHVAQYYFDIDRAPMARSILKKGMESADHNHIINVFYCNNLSFSASNNNTFERLLLPVLNNEQDS